MKLGIVCDYLEEGWFSMDICARMLHERAVKLSNLEIQTELICPNFNWRLKYFQQYISKAVNGDRFINRFVDYPQYLQQIKNDFELFHVADHSYAHLVHNLPADRTGVFCHDLDAFQSILAPQQYPRSWYYRQMSRHILTGMQKAAIVFYTTNEIRRQIELYQIIDPARLVAAPLGISPEYHSHAIPDDPASVQIQERLQGRPFMLHVGSCIPRKRIDILLETFGELRRQLPELALVKVGGEWSQAQQQQIARLELERSIVHLTNLENHQIARLYQQAKLVLMPSEAEGFGLPVIEALACGAIVIASDIPVLREVGGDAVIYCPVGDVASWVERSANIILHRDFAPPMSKRLSQARCYSWDNHARVVIQAYQQLCR